MDGIGYCNNVSDTYPANWTDVQPRTSKPTVCKSRNILSFHLCQAVLLVVWLVHKQQYVAAQPLLSSNFLA